MSTRPPTFSQQNNTDQLMLQGQALIDLRRYADAEKLFSRVTAASPQDWRGHYYLALALLNQADGKPQNAQRGLEEARRAVGLDPARASCHFMLSLAYVVNRKYPQALDSAHAGMRLDPQRAWGYELVAQIHIFRREWSKALQAAETGLGMEPENVSLLNSHAEALTMLGRREEAQTALRIALERDPTSPRSLANRGWLALHQNQPVEALGYFRESMRLDPTSEVARAGLLASMQAHNPLYRLMLRYYLWTSRLTQGEFWAAIAMVNGFNTALRVAARIFPPLWIIALPYLLFFWFFSFFTWIADGFYNFLTRLSPTGRLVLNKEETASANGCGFLGALVLINLVAFVAMLFINASDFHRLWIFFVGGMAAAGMMVPVAGVFKVHPERRTPRTILLVMAMLLGACSLTGWIGSFTLAPWHGVALALFIVGGMIYPWVANIIIVSQ